MIAIYDIGLKLDGTFEKDIVDKYSKKFDYSYRLFDGHLIVNTPDDGWLLRVDFKKMSRCSFDEIVLSGLKYIKNISDEKIKSERESQFNIWLEFQEKVFELHSSMMLIYLGHDNKYSNGNGKMRFHEQGNFDSIQYIFNNVISTHKSG